MAAGGPTFATDETLEEMRRVDGADAAAVIDDDHADLAITVARVDRDRAGGRTVGDRVGKKIDEHLLQQFGLAIDDR